MQSQNVSVEQKKKKKKVMKMQSFSSRLSLSLETHLVFTKTFSAGNIFSGEIVSGSTENEAATSNNGVEIPDNLNV